MSFKLDKTDLRILKILQEKGRISNLQLSREIELSPAPTLERVRKLEAANIIMSYHAFLNEKLLGLDIKAIVLVSLTRQRENAMQHFAGKIEEMDEVIECLQITGTYDYQLKVVVKDIIALNDLISEKLSKMEEIRKIQSYIILSTIKQTKALPLKNEEMILDIDI